MIKKSIQWIAMAGFSLLLIGCSTGWTKDQCVHTDWYGFGQNHGAEGQPAQLDSIVKQCKAFDVTVNQQAYHQGYHAGLMNEYCTFQGGVHQGESGHPYHGQCPPGPHTDAFIQGWHQGLKSFCIVSVIEELGRNGKPFPYWCPTNWQPRLRVAYNRGLAQRQRAEVISSQEQSIQDQIFSIDTSINQLESQGVPSTDSRIMDYQQQKYQLQDQLFQLQREAATAPDVN